MTARAGTALGVVWVVLAGSALHFVFDWGRRSPVLAPFAPVNESVWEHAKMAFWPALVFLAFDPRRRVVTARVAWVATVVASLVGPLVVVAGFYAYTAFVPHGLAADVLLFVVAASAGQLSAAWIYRRSRSSPRVVLLASTLFAAFVVAQTLWTFQPPHVPPFRDGLTGRYGIPARR